MLHIFLNLPYPDATPYVSLWANEEEKINFRTETDRADRCTLAFAATELAKYLTRCGHTIKIGDAENTDDYEAVIRFSIPTHSGIPCAFSITPTENGCILSGTDRTGVLYSAYALAEMQGFRFISYENDGERLPGASDTLCLPDARMDSVPCAPLGRGFEFEGVLKDSEDVLYWMARNRMNLCGYRPATTALAKKLGMIEKTGGHIFEALLAPEQTASDGRTFWDAHRDWYGTPSSGDKELSRALYTQFCVTNTALCDYLGEALLQNIMGKWYGADRIDVWPFDTWGNVCACEKCRALGNGTDQALYFLSQMRAYLNDARRQGRLDHDVQLVLTAYEGTSTLAAPSKPVPENLTAAGDYVVYCPILRCYDHALSDTSCSYNSIYADTLSDWMAVRDRIPVMLLEYYNVSKLEDLPVLYTERIASDLSEWFARGVSGFAYMHFPLVNWGVRTLTQCLCAALSWNRELHTAQFLAEYFTARYGPYADLVREAYDEIEAASAQSTSWRAWGDRSMLTVFAHWDGTAEHAAAAYTPDDHLLSSAVACGYASLKRLNHAMELCTYAQSLEKDRLAGILPHENGDADNTPEAGTAAMDAVNPIELARLSVSPHIERALLDDRMGLRYGILVYRLMTELAACFDAIVKRDADAFREHYAVLSVCEEDAETQCMPLTFHATHARIECRDVLTRAQIREPLRKMRRFAHMLRDNPTLLQ